MTKTGERQPRPSDQYDRMVEVFGWPEKRLLRLVDPRLCESHG
jgi:hypothetical protein